jgi:RNA polymerase sigma-70 factor (ECF subfamily)
VRTEPVAGSTGVDPALTEIRVTFSKPMQDGSWSWSTWGEENFPEVAGDIHYLPDGRTCVLPVKLKPGKFYASWLNSSRFKNFTDTENRPAVPYLLTFETAGGSGGGGGGGGLGSGGQGGGGGGGMSGGGGRAALETASDPLNEDQRLVLAWTDRQFRSYFDARTFTGLSDKERTDLEARLLDTLRGPQDRDYYQAINTLAALRPASSVASLLAIADNREDKDCRDRWMAIRALGMMGDRSVVPALIHLVYHGNANTRWWAQISLVRLTGKNFGKDWQAWGDWWNQQGGEPPFKPDIIRWWSGQPEPEKLAGALAESDQKFLAGIKPHASTGSSASQTEAPTPAQTPEPSPIPGLAQAVQLHHDTGLKTGMESINGSGHAVQFIRPADARYLEAVQIFASRYGAVEPPKEDFHLYVLNERQQVLADVPFPYAMIQRAGMKWYSLRTPSIEVPDKFMIALAFNPHRTKGIYLAYSATNGPCHSLIGLPGDGFETWRPVEWMIRPNLTAEPTKAKGFQRLADRTPPAQDPSENLSQAGK